ncbi:MAG: DUF86 domain-containing protein [Acidobacteriales bacterium]|nr:DUF86 domain-containing protein [Terriglobales bacterium]
MTRGDPRIYLLHIRDCCQELIECGKLRNEHVVPPSILFSAVCRNLEVIGEASKKVGVEFQQRHPGVPWREMSDLRNVLIHNYEGADEEMVWAIVEQDITPLLAEIDRIITSGA